MTREQDEIRSENKMVVTVDICSSTHIMNDLLERENIKIWRDLLITMKDYVRKILLQNITNYKFIGDGWIILIDEPYSARNIFKFLSEINKYFDKSFTENVLPTLDIVPETSGLTFGVDEGKLTKIKMDGINEYIGRAINVACRLQGAINEIDIKDGYRVIISNRLYNVLKDDLGEYYAEVIERPLRNIGGGRGFRCYRLFIPNFPLDIIEASYGTDQRSMDVRSQYLKKIINGKLDVLVSNEIAGRDPHEGKGKKLKIKYIYNGEIKDEEFLEKSRIKLPFLE